MNTDTLRTLWYGSWTTLTPKDKRLLYIQVIHRYTTINVQYIYISKYVLFSINFTVRISNISYRQYIVDQQVMEAPRWDYCHICRSPSVQETSRPGYSSNRLFHLLCTPLCWGTASCHQGFQEEGTDSLKEQKKQISSSKLTEQKEMFPKASDFSHPWEDLRTHFPFSWVHVPSGRQLMNWNPSRSNPVWHLNSSSSPKS